MKKLLLILTISLSLLLTGCIPAEVVEPVDNSMTEEEISALINELIPEATVNTTYDLTSFQTAVTNMIEVARSGVIGIINTTDEGAASGSGVIYKQDGDVYYVVTNSHVVENSTFLTIVYEKNGILFDIEDEHIELLGLDPTTDLAVLTFESTEYFSVIPFADSYDIKVGQFVFALGNPLGFEYYGTVTMGIVSGLTRYVIDGGFNATLLQHDAAISPGNSGGALLNVNGELIGINNMKIIDDYVTGIGFAIPSNTVRRITTDLEDDGIVTRPYLGITTYAQLNVCGTEYGVCVDVQEGGAAEAAGLQNGDTIVGYKNSSYDEFRSILNFNDLKEAILNSQVGEEIQLQYIRDGELYTSDVATLGTHPDD
ncbi:MAG: trypsin-like peptidase domain-containing protein [Candidatus Izimaplasma sp.]|nr:trypsin-like peptidase domain-containing protein [Candidatus Izimaplasma bacterium]